MANSPEYNSIIDCIPELRLSVEPNLITLCGELLCARLINEVKEKSLRNINVEEADRAAKLVSLITDKIKENPENYHKFVAILKKDEQVYSALITLLEKSYESRTRGPTEPSEPKQQLPSLNHGHDSGQPDEEIVKTKTDVGSKSVVDSSTQTLHATGQHEVHPFGGACGCGICGCDLGCPNPLPAEATFPLLEHIDGLGKEQKDDLCLRLKKETKDIMMHFYRVLSMFFSSLKERKVSVDDIKTHLMVLDAFNDDDDDDNQHQPVFHEQMDKLDNASTINEIFKVIKVFCSFVNYDLVEYLIDIIGMEEDRARLTGYKRSFAEYAKRRIYECPPKTAVSTPGQCDMYVKLDSHFSKLSLNDLREFRFNISRILNVSHHLIRLCCIEKGCIRLTFQIPYFVKEHSFPLTSEQRDHLLQLGVLSLICGDYELPNEDKPDIPPVNDYTHSRANAQSCLDCNSNAGVIPLLCQEHYVCNDCLVKRTASAEQMLTCNSCNQAVNTSPTFHSKQVDSLYTYRDAVLYKDHTETQVETGEQQKVHIPLTDATQARGIWIFVNDSNIWIEAKKLQSKQKMFKTSEDHRVRMDMGKLADVLAKGRPIQQGILYGSEPPSIDSVWEKIHEQGWKVHITQSTSKRGQLSTKIVVDVVTLAEKTPPKERSSIILVTGDAGIIPAIEKVVEIEGWNVEVYMWSHATSKQLQKLQLKHKNRVSVSSLDSYLNDVIFTNMKFNFSNKNFLEMVKKSSVVLTVSDDSSSFPGHIPTDQWMRKLEELAQWPCQYCWYNHPETGRTNKLVVIFRDDSKVGQFNVANFLDKVTSDDKYQIPSVIRIQSFLQFMSSDQLERFGGDFEQFGLFSQTDAQSGLQVKSVYVTNTHLGTISNSSITKWSSHLVLR